MFTFLKIEKKFKAREFGGEEPVTTNLEQVHCVVFCYWESIYHNGLVILKRLE